MLSRATQDATLRDDAPPPHAAPPPRVCPRCDHSYPYDFLVCPRDGTSLSGDRPRTDPLLGAFVGGIYRVTRVVGSGAMGKLYEAEHVRLDRRFAVKVLHELYADKHDAIVRFEREARACARVRSDHVVDVLDVLRTPDDRPCIVTEMLDGEDLQARLDRIGKMPLMDALVIARQTCRGLAAVHAHGVVHRDLKPSNLFLCAEADGRISVKVLDFGVAKLVGEAEFTRGGTVVGTPAYMAPEQARGSADVDERADVYAVGAVLYRMLAGKPPFLAGDPTATLAMLLEGPPPRPCALDRTIPEGIESVIQRAMARDRRDRYSSVAELEQALAVFDASGALAAESSANVWQAPAGRTTEEGLDTLVLARGSVHTADEHTRRARRARPFGAFVAASLALASGTAAQALLASFVAEPRWPAQAFGGWVFTVVCVLAWRALHQRWHSAAEIELLVGRWTGPLVAGLAAYGVASLLDGTWSNDASPGCRAAFGVVVSIAAWLVAARHRAGVTPSRRQSGSGAA